MWTCGPPLPWLLRVVEVDKLEPVEEGFLVEWMVEEDLVEEEDDRDDVLLPVEKTDLCPGRRRMDPRGARCDKAVLSWIS